MEFQFYMKLKDKTNVEQITKQKKMAIFRKTLEMIRTYVYDIHQATFHLIQIEAGINKNKINNTQRTQ